MSTDLQIALTDPHAPERLRWLDGDRAWRDGSWADFAAHIGTQPWALLLGGNQVTLFETTLPVRDLATARRAAPFAIEEQLAQPLDELEFALAPRGANVFAIAVCARDLIADLRARLSAADLHPELVAPFAAALPWQAQTLSIAVDNDCAVLRSGASGGFAVPLSGLAEAVALLRQQLPDTAAVNVYARSEPAAFPHAAFEGLTVHWLPPLAAADINAALAATAPPRLLDASRRAGSSARARRLWWGAAVAAVVVMLVYPLLLALGNAALARTERELAAANRAVFAEAFPAIARIVNPRVQAEQALAGLRAGVVTTPQFLDLLAAFDQAIAAELNASTRVRNVAFAGGVLEVSLELADMGELERLRSLLGQAGLGAEMLSAESTADAVIARLRLREPS
ncbi:MAG: type II secretion system protein GspL [Gammaproteobacteria bacterium]